jgi:hypothetical protein
MRNTILAIVTLSLFASEARAESSPPKDPTNATMIAIGATALPVITGMVLHKNAETAGNVVIVVGLALGPSAGHWYAGELGWPGLAVRSAGLAMILLTGERVSDCTLNDGTTNEDHCKVAGGVFLFGVGAYVTGMVYDWGTAGRAARRANARAVKIAPTVINGPRSTGAGLGLSARF